jgi:5-methyltetrahydrofolate--homocysteine methyltransferase
MNKLQAMLDSHPYLVADGAMGTMLFAAGLGHGGAPELWNVDHADKVAAVHQAYLEAGAQILLTNTFGCNRFRLELHSLQDRAAELNQAAARNLRQVVDASGKEALVAGDIGPSGQVMLPYGTLVYADAVQGFAGQAAALISAGVDLIWIETMADLEEVRAAIEGVRHVSADIPIISTMTFDTHGRTMMGVTPEKAISALASQGVTAVGGNCGNGPEEVVIVIEKMRAKEAGTPLAAKANAGIPVLEGGKPVYRAAPQDMAIYAHQVYAAGARIIGACCGSTPAHIQAIAAALAEG